MSDTIQASTREQVDEDAARADVRAVIGNDMGVEITDQTAVTIAAWWQSPGSIGRHLATLASGLPVDVTELLDDIAATRRDSESWGEPMEHDDALALDTLATWAMNHPSRTA